MPFGAFRLNGLSRYVAAIIAGRTAKTVTAYNQAQIDTAQSKFGGASALFDGNGDDHLSSLDCPNLGSGDFTVEFWIYPLSNSSGQSNGVITKRVAGNVGAGTWGVRFTDNGSVRTIVWENIINPVTNVSSSSNGWNYNNWYHWAFVRSGTTLKIYNNGTQVGSGTVNFNFTNTEPLRIGWWGTGATTIGANVDEVRISNIARYTANFTPSTTPFINDANTLMLLHMDGTDASTTFIDDNGTGRSAAGISATGNAQVDTAQSKFGGASALFDGTGDRLIVDNKSEFNFGSNNFTIEFWVRANNFTGLPGVLSMATVGSSDGWNLQFGTDGRLYIEYGFAGSVPNTRANTTALTANVWSHVAFVRNGSTVTAYKDGVAGTSHTISTSSINSSTADLVIGDGYGLATTWAATADFNGHIDELRISDTARYTANFTPSTTAFVNDANTLLLMHMNGTDGSTTFTDDNS